MLAQLVCRPMSGGGPEAQEEEMTCLGLHGEVFREPGLEL